MNISKLQALFAQIDLNKDNFISKAEMQKSSYNSIFGGYFQSNERINFETFSSTINSNSSSGSEAISSTSNPTQRIVPYEEHTPILLTSVPQNPEGFKFFVPWAPNGEGLIGNDASGLDLKKSLPLLLMSDFDNNTKFPPPENLPDGFKNPKQILESGKNPGLGLTRLHEEGFTGKAVNVAIIDNPISIDHEEFKDNPPDYHEIGINKNQVSEMHGMSVTSILAGKNVGVAPDAKVQYYATNPCDINTGIKTSKYRISALKEILKNNEILPEDKKIQAVSMSWSVDEKDPDYPEFLETVKNLEAKGVLVLYCKESYPHGFMFGGLTRDPLKDPNDPNAYKLSDSVTQQIGESKFACGNKGNVLLVASSNRTLAGPAGKDNYTLYPDGGSSWQAPYIVGVYSLAKQANPNLTPDEFRKLSMETGTPMLSEHGKLEYEKQKKDNPNLTVEEFWQKTVATGAENDFLLGRIINPEKLIKEVQNKN